MSDEKKPEMDLGQADVSNIIRDEPKAVRERIPTTIPATTETPDGKEVPILLDTGKQAEFRAAVISTATSKEQIARVLSAMKPCCKCDHSRPIQPGTKAHQFVVNLCEGARDAMPPHMRGIWPMGRPQDKLVCLEHETASGKPILVEMGTPGCKNWKETTNPLKFFMHVPGVRESGAES